MIDYNSPRLCVSDAGSSNWWSTNLRPLRCTWGKRTLVQNTNFNHFINLSQSTRDGWDLIYLFGITS